ncbi:outer membrane efflux protein, putative cobalt-zinc-cadmium resistance protein CzcC (plasmid) [Afipia carboxidovorans OM5]|uniref:Outer membrane efflux protein, putative cobalt-zinc-cadmium resistance protein CzcC n=1 Tax=Afipia carboxidovorans (strain ATCC 49405 / DSM 1227 / KCTC 32145 / OM5) TaxID=504832 RepID=F8C1G9_AFIC5|nr:TolC family protein [Afipia carboxidovorans]AEI04655.1 outer membrane efflux protein, putative cobalt-zinc-cadmium resistance protein CzcC [Afipia carboxidovorans OM4]AEI08284.1 outer membrane efflux protein, putative cobalt-zinc-cadmium resistance protein CzcC [Afipia carboxidovorans OM5]
MSFKCATRFACAIVLLVGGPLASAAYSQTLTMGAALQRALAASPRLTAAERDIGIARGQRVQSGALLNPQISYEQDNSFGSGAYRGTRSAESTLQISQMFELWGKRDARIAAGQAGLDAATIERRSVRLEVLSETAIAFVNVLGLQRRIQILDQQVDAINKITPLLQRRVEAGASSVAETGRAEAASALVKADRERVKSALASARRELAVLIGDPSPKFRAVAGSLEAVGKPPGFQSVVAAIDANPQLVRWKAIYAQRHAELLLARLKPYPDVTASVGWRRYNETGDSAVRFSLSVPIPVFDQNQGNILSAQESLAKTQAQRKANRNTLIVVAGRAYDSLQGSLRELSILRSIGIPKSSAAAAAISEGYGQGRYSLLEVLNAQNSLAQARLREQEAQQNFHVAVATIEGLVGNPFALARGRTR